MASLEMGLAGLEDRTQEDGFSVSMYLTALESVPILSGNMGHSRSSWQASGKPPGEHTASNTPEIYLSKESGRSFRSHSSFHCVPQLGDMGAIHCHGHFFLDCSLNS